MEKVLSNDLLKVLLVVFIGSMGAYMFLVNITKRIVGAAKSIRRKQNIYLIVGALVFALIAVTGYSAIFTDAVTFMLVYQLLFLGLGVLHYYLMNKWFDVEYDGRAFWFKLAFTLTLALIGFLLFIFVFRYFNRDGYQYLMGASVLCFVIPLLVYQVFLKATGIPPHIIKRWYYPIQQRVEEPDDKHLKNMFIVSFRFQKKLNDQFFTNFRAKAPAGMGFGNLFYFFINDYNERNPEDKIEFLDNQGEPQGWIFYKRARWYNVSTSYLDADETVTLNGLKENDVIICHRLQETAKARPATVSV
jgi:hypothetical protein